MVISIIVPFYNASSTLRSTVDSILSQNLKDLEVILVDDGSQDDSLLIAKKICQTDNRVVVVQQENSGVSAARNHGLRVAKGHYIAFVDADDSVDNTMYAEILAKMQAYEADIGVSGYCVNGEAVYDLRRFDYVLSQPEQIHKNLIVDILGGPNSISPLNTHIGRFVYKRDLLEPQSILFNTNIGYHEDLVFVLSSLTKATIVYIDGRPFYNYSYNEFERSKRHKLEKKIMSHKQVIDYLYQLQLEDCFGICYNYLFKITGFIVTICENICNMEYKSIAQRYKMLKLLFSESRLFYQNCNSMDGLRPKPFILFNLFMKKQFLLILFVCWLVRVRVRITKSN
ncbi:MAG: glycosyltransferase [Pseudomonadota bacterium]